MSRLATRVLAEAWPFLFVGGLGSALLAALGASRGEAGLYVLAALVLGGAIAFGVRKPLARARATSRPFPAEWRGLLENRVRFYRSLDAAGRARFERNLSELVASHVFEGVDGLEVTDELRVLAMAGAAMLVHGLPSWSLPADRTVIFYPDAFDREGYESSRRGDLAGIVHAQGPVIFSVKALRDGYRDARDGHNVAIHEFAHVVDLADGYADGVPGDARTSLVGPFARMVEDERLKVLANDSLLRDYAGTNAAELFAVAVESFFERPAKLKAEHPELYRALVHHFRLDPSRPMDPVLAPAAEG